MKGIALAAITAIFLAGCNDADIASSNLSKAADNFEINRRVAFYNGITGEYMLSIEGLCALGNRDDPRQRTITCKIRPDTYKKHFLGLSDNVTYFVEQIDGAYANAYHYRVIIKPQTILPDIDFRGSVGAATDAVTPDSRD
ncbi:hypothetical protein [Castellaniella sp.]|uniref:beta-sandwich lipoprotein n=1 Tax=Castellaniella sp. TaxID=1955812 RepID=UPI003C73BCE4